MMIQVIPADSKGNLLMLKNYEYIDGKHFLEFRCSFNDIPYRREEIYPVEDNFVITGDDGTVIYRFHQEFLKKIKI